MKIIKPTKAIASAVRILKRGGVIIYPTETSYGIGADATNAKAIKKIIKLKGRAGKFMPIIISDMKMAEKYIVLNDDMRKLVKKFMPGPLTLIAEKKNVKTKKLLGGFRIPSNAFARKLAKKLSKPVTATSANISGKKPIYNIAEIKKVFAGKADLIIDAGRLPRRRPSTVFDVYNKKVVRQGKIKLKAIERVISSSS